MFTVQQNEKTIAVEENQLPCRMIDYTYLELMNSFGTSEMESSTIRKHIHPMLVVVTVSQLPLK